MSDCHDQCVTLEIPLAYRVTLTLPVDHSSCAEESDDSFPRAIYDWLGLVIARLHASLFQKISRPNSTTKNAKIIVSTQLF